MGQRIFIHDVVARDGFQIEPSWIPTERKIEIIDLLSSTGVAKIEATSFVSPKAVPNLRDAAEVMAGIRRNPAVTYVALVPTIVMDLYGARSVSGIIGSLYTGAGIGTLLGPWLAGAAFDALGSYDLPILAAAALSFLAACCIVPLARQKAQLVHSSQ